MSQFNNAVEGISKFKGFKLSVEVWCGGKSKNERCGLDSDIIPINNFNCISLVLVCLVTTMIVAATLFHVIRFIWISLFFKTKKLPLKIVEMLSFRRESHYVYT